MPSTQGYPSDGGYADYVAQTAGMSPDERAMWFYETRVAKRKDASGLAWLNDLLRMGMLDLNHVDNEMYCDLLAGHMTHVEWGQFLCEYYWGSGYGFQRVVLPAAAKGSSNDTWHAYIKSIIYEENTPSSHCEMFKCFIASLGFDIGEMPESASTFNQRMLAGYGGRLGYALGYALAVETEADFQISLLFAALRARYEDQVEATEFFRIHMNEYGEELHAQETCAAIEELFDQGLCTESEIRMGFQQAIIDTRDYMCTIRANIRVDNGAEVS